MKKIIIAILLITAVAGATYFPQTQLIDAAGHVLGITTGGAAKVDGSATTQPISATSLPLPSGASTSANQSTEITALGTINTTLGTPFQAGGSIGNTAFIANAGTNLNTSALNLEATQSSFKSANHTDLGTINTTLGTPFQAGGSIGNTAFIANAGTNLNTSLLALDSTVAKDSSLSTINTSINTLLKPANTLAAVTTLGSITSALPTGTNSIGQVTANAGTNLNTSALALDSSITELNVALEELTQSQGSTTSGQVGPLIQIATTTSAPTYTTGTTNPLSGDTAGYLRVVSKNGSNSYSHLTGAATTTVKSGSGYLHTLCVNNATSASVITVYDNTAASGTQIAVITAGTGSSAQSFCSTFDVNFSTGLTIVRTVSTTDITISYQ